MKKPEVTIIDYGSGNLLSLKRAFEYLGADVIITNENNLILKASRIVLPGVGAFSKAMESIEKLEIKETIISAADKNIPFLGVCLGMQLLFTESEEFQITNGLNLIQGRVISVPNKSISGRRLILPHIGWNSLFPSKNLNSWKGSILENNKISDEVYFIHSFMAAPQKIDSKVAECIYGDHKITAVVEKNNIIGCQFHPEKSGEAGLKILKTFIKK